MYRQPCLQGCAVSVDFIRIAFMRRRRRSEWTLAGLFVAAALLATASLGAAAQRGTPQELLELQRREIELDEARSHLERTAELHQQGLVSESEKERAARSVTRARLHYQESLLSVLDFEPRVSVAGAVKTRQANGRRTLRLTLVNVTPRVEELGAVPDELRDALPADLTERRLRNVFVSLQEAAGSDGAGGGTVVAIPYEARVPVLPWGRPVVVEFQLLRDLESVTVDLSHRGHRRQITVQPQHAEGDQPLTIVSTQASQEADLGAQATFDLQLERSSSDLSSFVLDVVGLPQQVGSSFVDPQTEARLSQVTFPAAVSRLSLALRVFLPERLDGTSLTVDDPIEFWVVAMPPEVAQELGGAPPSLDRIDRARIGAARLSVVPRGVGRIEVSAPTLFAESPPGDIVRTVLEIRNAGSRALHNVDVLVEAPVEWQASATPRPIPTLAVGEEQRVEVLVQAPAEAPEGDYEVRLRTISHADNRRVPSEDKIFRVSLKGDATMAGTVGLLTVLVALVGGIVVAGVKLTRR
jgi:hypothetical protein